MRINLSGIFSGWNLFGTLTLLVSLGVGFGVPAWKEYYVDTSDLSVELNGISRDISPEVGISLNSHSDLALLQRENETSSIDYNLRYLFSDQEVAREDGFINLKELEKLSERLNQLRATLPERIKDAKFTIAAINAITIDNYQDISKYLFTQSETDTYKRLETGTPTKGTLKALKTKLVHRYQSDQKGWEDRLRDIQLNQASAESKALELLNEVTNKESFFTVSAVLINSGKRSISIKKPALLRIYVGTGTYIDVELELEKYSTSAEVAQNGTQIVTFNSNKISKLPENDQNLVGTYWGQSVHSILFVQDLNGVVISSNRIPFSEGLYQKVIYDQLAESASKQEHFSSAP
ncbi:hypothetical protein ACRRGR_004807 [Vibrio alginolyticus]|nr:hypothetical protein [Vibrio alginolyticus]